MKTPERLTLSVVPGIPLLKPGADLGEFIVAAIGKAGIALRDGDIVVVAQKAVSKAQGRYVDLATVTPSWHARELAAEVDKDPRLVQVILSESVRIVRKGPGVLIVEHRSGYIMANAGVDQSNVSPETGAEPVLLLPVDADAAAESLCAQLSKTFAKQLGVVISDSFGRPWRLGTVGIALGAAGIPSLRDLRGRPDLHGRPLQFTETGFADEVAAAAALVMGQAAEGHPVAIVSGFVLTDAPIAARALIRPAAEDLFR
ncbi:MAG TPA: coenzyme F420-0:L-glutamate ligase [Xanthobacteraceae bacterium]|nr:coenzyme F420-0:L-glutamate ligase [Xanthobacteraceae bacterium]